MTIRRAVFDRPYGFFLDRKAVQSFVLRHRFVLITTLYFFFTFSAPLGRLTPIEALPQTPQGTLSLDPASPLTPGLCLRFTSRFARC